jgi:hypothetical protein
MTGDERVRFCGQCEKHVYNLAEMTADEARDLITKREGKGVCVRVTRRADGTVVTGSCRARLRAAWERGPLAFAGALVIVFAIQVWAQAFGLRALGVFLRCEPSRPTADEIERTPVARGPRAIRSPLLRINEETVTMGSVPPEPIGEGRTVDDAGLRVPPDVAAYLKRSGKRPQLPRIARGRGQARDITATVTVSTAGRVDDVLVGDEDPAVRAAVARAVKKWTYRPLVVEGSALRFHTVLTFTR